MNLISIEKSFSSYLEKFWICSDLKRFLLAYIQLLLLFRGDLSSKVVDVVMERQKQLHGEVFDASSVEGLMLFSRGELNRHLKNNSESTSEAILNRLLFCALLDTDETDFFYLTEPMFEFARKMNVSPIELKKILESEFAGFKVEG